MGGGASGEIDRVADHIYPIWYIKDAEVSAEDEKILKSTWDSILDGSAKGYILHKGDQADYPSSLVYFYDQFYKRLFEVHPASKELFKNNMTTQGKALIQMITAALSLVKKDPVALTGALTGLAKGHAHKGMNHDFKFSLYLFTNIFYKYRSSFNSVLYCRRSAFMDIAKMFGRCRLALLFYCMVKMLLCVDNSDHSCSNHRRACYKNREIYFR